MTWEETRDSNTFSMSTTCRYNLAGLGLQGFVHELALAPALGDKGLRSAHRMESEQEINTGPDSADGTALLPQLTHVTSWCLLLPLWLQEIQQDNPELTCNFHIL